MVRETAQGRRLIRRKEGLNLKRVTRNVRQQIRAIKNRRVLSHFHIIGGKSVRTSVLAGFILIFKRSQVIDFFLIDLAGSEKATSDKERTREGKYINTSLLTLGSVIGTLAENASTNKKSGVTRF